jgi:hypothetical protein
VQSVGNTLATNLGSPTRKLQNIKDKHADWLAKKTCRNLPHPCVATFERPWLVTTHFQKCLNMQNILCTVTEYSMSLALKTSFN